MAELCAMRRTALAGRRGCGKLRRMDSYPSFPPAHADPASAPLRPWPEGGFSPFGLFVGRGRRHEGFKVSGSNANRVTDSDHRQATVFDQPSKRRQ